MMFSALRLALFLAAVGLFITQAALVRAGESDPDASETALKHITVTLQYELKANEQEGKAISGKFEIEHDALQLPVYTLDGDDFLEVIADPNTGAIAKTEKIADADDLKDALGQKAAMQRATVSLVVAADAAANAEPWPTRGQHLSATARRPSGGRGDAFSNGTGSIFQDGNGEARLRATVPIPSTFTVRRGRREHRRPTASTWD
jgi:hypothetical protein